MDLLKTMVLYLSLVFATSVETAPEPSLAPVETPVPTVYVQATATPAPTPKPTPVPTINITPNPAYKTLQVGDRGDQVREMQEKLIAYGYLQGEADGAYGNQTRRAVEAFQYQHGLSVDGIAGRNTLTVLYESDEIRMAPQAEPTPTPTATSQLSVARTAEPTASPTPEASFVPVTTIQPTHTPAPTARPTATPVPQLEAMEGYAYVLSDGQTELEALPYRVGDMVYVPLVEVLRAMEMNVITSTNVEQDEFAFAIGDELIRISYSENQQGEPVQLQAYRNLEPQILPSRDIRRVEETLYLPASCVQSLTGITAQVDETAAKVRLGAPEQTEAQP